MKFKFADCEIDVERQVFWKSDKVVSLEPQVFELVAFFAERPGQLVTRADLVDVIWGGRIVSDSTISTRINAVRRAIGDDDPKRRKLETLSKRGYRLAVEVVQGIGNHSVDEPAKTPIRQSVKAARSQDGTIISHATSGNGAPLLRAGQFLTHLNLDWESQIRRPLLDQFGEHFSLTRYDQRGTGLSGSPETDYSLERLVEDMLAVADNAGLERFPIWASSQGVPVSLAFAAAHPDRVSRMVLYGGFVQGRAKRENGKHLGLAETLIDLIAEGWGKPDGAFGKAYTTLFMPDATSEQIEDMCRMQLVSASSDTAIALRRAIDSFDVSDLVASVEVPVLVIHCTDDSVNPLEQSRLMTSLLPDASLTVVDGRNHVPLPGTAAWEVIVSSSIDFLKTV